MAIQRFYTALALRYALRQAQCDIEKQYYQAELAYTERVVEVSKPLKHI